MDFCDKEKEPGTIPWHDDEMIIVNGQRLAYEFRGEHREMWVHFSGGAVPLAEVRAHGWKIVQPKLVREK